MRTMNCFLSPRVRTERLSRPSRVVITSLVGLSALLAGPSMLIAPTSAATPKVGAVHQLTDASSALPTLPSPPQPPTARPTLPANYQAPIALLGRAQAVRTISARLTSAILPPPQAHSWGTGSTSTLVLYDTTGQWGYLGELYAEAAGNLASHFGSVTAEPVIDYESGQLAQYSATIYIGSTYNEPLPVSFLNDALSATTPVLWMGDNIWQLSGSGATDTAFQAAYGWDPSTSYYDTTDTIASVGYNGQTFTRNTLNGPVLAPHITSTVTPSPVAQLGQANCESPALVAQACASIAQAPGGATATSFPWAIKSANLTYLGEIPLSYINETDRYVAFSGLLENVLDPNAAPSHLALVRLEDLSPADDPTVLVEIAQYLHSVGVPFSMNIISDYVDPSGYYNNGVPVNEPLDGTDAASVAFVAAIKQMMALGGTLNMEGYTHQYTATGATVTDNPYSGVSGDDFEFYRAQCSTTATPPYVFDSPCANTDHVIEEGPVPEDSAAWAAGRINSAIAQFAGAGLPVAPLFIFPHYAASAVDYQQMATLFPASTSGAYDRRLYFGGALTPGAAPNYNEVEGQFFPYTVHDLYGTTVVPENLGDYEPTAMNGNPIRNAADIIAEAKDNLAVTQGTASFFFDPDYFTNNDPTGVLQTIVTGIQSLGYTFVSPVSLLGSSLASSAPTLYVATNSLPAATVGAAYTATLTAAGGTGADTWSLTKGALPAGLTLNSTTGVISGTPTAPGSSTVTVTAQDANTPAPDSAWMSLTIAVAPAALTISTTSLPAGLAGTAYAATLASSGGTGAVTWSITSGKLPTGLTLNATTGAITGTPTAASSTSLTVHVADSASPPAVATATLTLTVTAPLTVTTTSLVAGKAGSPYSATLTATGGVGSHTWSITLGTLPAGLTLKATTGVISGKPTGASSTSLTVRATDSASPADVATKALTLTVAGVPISITTSSLPKGVVGRSYNGSLASSGGLGAHTWSVSSGTLPAGLVLNAKTGKITGKPTHTGTTSVTFKVSDGASPADTATKTIPLTVV
jgi:uncharacterized protein YdaL